MNPALQSSVKEITHPSAIPKRKEVQLAGSILYTRVNIEQNNNKPQNILHWYETAFLCCSLQGFKVQMYQVDLSWKLGAVKLALGQQV